MDTAISRRGFVKAGATLGALGAAGIAGMTATDTWLKTAKASATPEEKTVCTFHQCHCRGNCTLKCTVRDGRVCKIEPNPAAEEEFHKVCLKGLSEVQHIYADTRIQTPLRRVGERGEGKFEAISWDEALDTLVEEVHKIWDKYGHEGLLFYNVTENANDSVELPKLLGCSVHGASGLDIGYANGMWEILGKSGKANQSCVTSSLDIRDLKNTKTFISMGSNFMETGLTHCSAFFDAKDAGMYSICVDPNFTTTAGKCDQWVSIEPGTDPAFFLGLITCVLDNNWYDETFCKLHTSLPFLINKTTGELLRDHATLLDEKGNDTEDGTANPFKVLDEQGNLVNAEEAGEHIKLEGSIIIDDVEYTTVFSQLKENAKNYSLQWAAEKTTISEDVLYDIADRYANHGPSRIDVGYGGGDRYQNVDIASHAMGILAALTGNYGKFGSGIGVTYNAGYPFGNELATWKLPSTAKSKTMKQSAFRIPYSESNIHGLLSWGDVQQRFGSLEDMWEWVRSLDFVCVADIFSNTTVQYADLVLPICTRFEAEEDVAAIKTSRYHVALREKCIDPLFDSKSDFAAQLAILQAFGLADDMPKNSEEYVRYQLEQSTSKKLANMTLEELRAHDNVLAYRDFDTVLSKPKFSDYKFGGASGRLDCYYTSLIDYGQALPIWEEPNQVKSEHPDLPLRFLSVKTRFRLHAQFCDASWIRQFCNTQLQLNPEDTQSRGLSDGNEVRISNDNGNFGCTAVANSAVRPGTCKIIQGEWAKYVSFGNEQNVTNVTETNRGLALPNGPVLMFNDTLVEVAKA